MLSLVAGFVCRQSNCQRLSVPPASGIYRTEWVVLVGFPGIDLLIGFHCSKWISIAFVFSVLPSKWLKLLYFRCALSELVNSYLVLVVGRIWWLYFENPTIPNPFFKS